MPDPAPPLQSGPCIICAGVDYPLSAGGWNICPHCDIGASKETSPYRPSTAPLSWSERQAVYERLENQRIEIERLRAERGPAPPP